MPRADAAAVDHACLTLLNTGPLGSRHLARFTHNNLRSIQRSLRRLLNAGTITYTVVHLPRHTHTRRYRLTATVVPGR